MEMSIKAIKYEWGELCYDENLSLEEAKELYDKGEIDIKWWEIDVTLNHEASDLNPVQVIQLEKDYKRMRAMVVSLRDELFKHHDRFASMMEDSKAEALINESSELLNTSILNNE